MLNMKGLLSPTLAIALVSQQPAMGELPKISSLQPGEQLSVGMTLSGYTISRSHFLFASDRVHIRSGGKALGSLVLTPEDKTKVDEYLDAVRRGSRGRQGDEGYTFSISYLQNQKRTDWTFQIEGPRESSKPTLSLHELQKRAEDKEKAKEIKDPSDAYLKAYLLIGNAGKTTDRQESSRRLEQALACLDEIRKKFPEWKKDMVETRIAETRKVLNKHSGAGD